MDRMQHFDHNVLRQGNREYIVDREAVVDMNRRNPHYSQHLTLLIILHIQLAVIKLLTLREILPILMALTSFLPDSRIGRTDMERGHASIARTSHLNTENMDICGIQREMHHHLRTTLISI